MVMGGPDELFGANAVILEDGKVIYLKNLSSVDEILPLRYGMQVERHLMEGDYVTLNRQPSLHKVSYQGHRIRVTYLRPFHFPVFTPSNFYV
jgi:DNA-directed RNA polymerase beta' subunit